VFAIVSASYKVCVSSAALGVWLRCSV